MKPIFEDYGMIILACVVIIVLIGLTTGLGDFLLDALKGIIENWSSQVNNAVNIPG